MGGEGWGETERRTERTTEREGGANIGLERRREWKERGRGSGGERGLLGEREREKREESRRVVEGFGWRLVGKYSESIRWRERERDLL